MSFWQIVTPLAAQNLVTQPTVFSSGSSVPSNYTAAGASLSLDTVNTRRGVQSIKVTPTSANFDGVYYSISLTSGSTYYASCDFWGKGNINYRVFFANGGSTPLGTAGSTTGTDYWANDRPVATYTAGSTGTYRVYVAKNNTADTNPFWVDGLMVQTAGSACTYIDGNQPGCSWDSAAYASTSTRSGQTREGGQLVDLATYALSIQEFDGVGTPDVANILLPFGLQDGAFYQRTQALPRVFTILGNVNTSSLQANASWNTLHANRKAFIDATRHDSTGNDQAFWLRYTGTTTRPMWIKAVYQDGLKAKIGQMGFVEQPGAKFVCPDPFYYEDGVDAMITASSVSVTSASAAVWRNTSGTWSGFGSGFNAGANVLCFFPCPDGTVLVGGLFTTGNGVTLNDIGRWSNVTQTFTAFSTGMNNTVRGMVQDASGNVYAVGDFTTAGGTAANHVAKWNGASWSALTSGGSNGLAGAGVVGNQALIGIDGNLYVAGIFTTAGSTTCNNIAMWNGSAWSALSYGGSAGVNNVVTSMVVGKDGNIYVGGSFSTAGSVSAKAVAMWNTSTSQWQALSTGLNDEVWSLAVGPDGTIYAGGQFTKTGDNVTTLNGIAAWNGTSWNPLSTGISNQSNTPIVYGVAPTTDGLLYIAGQFDHVGGLAVPDDVAVWNGSSWVFADFISGSVPSLSWATIQVDTAGNIYAAPTNSSGGPAPASSINSVVNAGDAATYPVITFNGPGRLYQLRNYTTGASIFFNYTLISGETATLTLTPGKIAFNSNYRGNILYSILPGSTLTGFKLLPGTNSISVFGSTGASSVFIQFPNRFWSIDGGAN